MIPNFIVIGAAKCGTTSVCDLLGAHPQVFMSDPKEPCYYSHRDKKERTLEWYESLFSQVRDERAVGEGSTAYTHPDVIETAAQRIKEDIPDCRLIYMVRHPIRRLESDWRMRLHEGWAPESISKAVRGQPTLISHGMFWKNLSVYRALFSDEQILVVFLEDFTRSPEAELARCFAHIGADPEIPIDDAATPRNTSAGFRHDSRLATALRRWSAFEAAKGAMPGWLIRGAKQLLTRQVKFTLQWEEEVKSDVARALAPDTARFLAHCGKPRDFWDLED